jgi:hypothetical protein
MVYWWLNDIFGAGVKVVWVVRDVAGRQTMMNFPAKL